MVIMVVFRKAFQNRSHVAPEHRRGSGQQDGGEVTDKLPLYEGGPGVDAVFVWKNASRIDINTGMPAPIMEAASAQEGSTRAALIITQCVLCVCGRHK